MPSHPMVSARDNAAESTGGTLSVTGRVSPTLGVGSRHGPVFDSVHL
jgi:hypothetical protein